MRAMILAAGRGERMRELTQHTPKPLLRVGDQYLIDYAIFNLKRAGIHEIVINVCYHGEQIKATLGNGERYGVRLIYSTEAERLEVGGGIFNALHLLGDAPFIVISSDVICDYALAQLPREPKELAHLVLVDNPPFHPKGDFGLQNGYVAMEGSPTFNYAGIGIYTPQVFAECKQGHFSWKELMFPLIQQKKVTGEYYRGLWFNIGTPKDLDEVNHYALENANSFLTF
jgi:MurNAc alpha-1-phosphate uridylyltransferase